MASSRDDLEALIGRPVPWFAYPLVDRSAFNDPSVRLASQIFDLAVFGDEQDTNPSGTPFRLPRHYVGDWPEEEFRARLTSWLAA